MESRAPLIPHIIIGASVTLRPWTRGDRRAIAAWPHPELPAAWLATGPVAGPRESYAIETRAGLIGRLTLRDITSTSAWIGIYLHPEWYGRGYGSDALSRASEHLLSAGGLRQLTLDVADTNHRAQRAYRRAGYAERGFFVREGVLYRVMERSAA